MPWEVTVEALMMSLNAEEIGWGFGCGGGAFAEPIDTGHVVRQRGDGAFANIGRLCDDVVVSDVATQL
jgi:hypothetical protein